MRSMDIDWYYRPNARYRCKIPECDVDNSGLAGEIVDYKPAWLHWAIPTDSNGEPDRCSRYQPAVTVDQLPDGINNSTCREASFNASTVIGCDEFVFASDEVTIVNAVSSMGVGWLLIMLVKCYL